MTDMPPCMNVPASAIFCEVVLCKRQMYGIGRKRSAKSVKMWGTKLPIKKLWPLMHFADILSFQNPETGSH